MSRGKRDTRFATLRTFYVSHEAGFMDMDACKKNVGITGYVIYESELEKFAVDNPDIDMEGFKTWLNNVSALKMAGRKLPSEMADRNSLNTPEKAAQIGVAPENVETYISLIETMFQVRDELKKIVTKGTVSLAIPLRKEKVKKAAAETVAPQ